MTRSGKDFACVSDDLCVRILQELWAPLASSAVWLEGFRRKNYHMFCVLLRYVFYDGAGVVFVVLLNER